MPGYASRYRLLPIVAALCVGSCLSTEGYYRYQDAGATGTAGTMGGAGTLGTAGTTGNGGGGAAGTSAMAGTGGAPLGAAGTTGSAGSIGGAGRGGTTGSAGRGGTTGSAGRGGTTGSAGVSGTAGAAGVLFSDNFDPMKQGWDFSVSATYSLMTDGTQVLNLSETAGDQALAAVGDPTWTNVSVEARVKVIQFTGTSSSDVAAICARLSDAAHFYYFAIQSDGKGKIKIQNNGNSSIGSSIDFGYTANTWYTLKLTVVGSTLTAYVNGTMVGAPVTDSNLTAGGIGLMVQRTNAVFDDVVVRTAP